MSIKRSDEFFYDPMKGLPKIGDKANTPYGVGKIVAEELRFASPGAQQETWHIKVAFPCGGNVWMELRPLELNCRVRSYRQ